MISSCHYYTYSHNQVGREKAVKRRHRLEFTVPFIAKNCSIEWNGHLIDFATLKRLFSANSKIIYYLVQTVQILSITDLSFVTHIQYQEVHGQLDRNIANQTNLQLNECCNKIMMGVRKNYLVCAIDLLLWLVILRLKALTWYYQGDFLVWNHKLKH